MKRPATPSTPILTPAARLVDALAALALALVELAAARDEEVDEVEFVEVVLLHDAAVGFLRHVSYPSPIKTKPHVPVLRRREYRSVEHTAEPGSGPVGRKI